MKLKELVLLFLIVFISLLLRLWRLDFPAQMYFDELYHVPAAVMMAQADFATPFEWWHASDWQKPVILTNFNQAGDQQYFDWLHPPLAKYFQALAIKLAPSVERLSFYWRLPSVLAASASLIVFYFLAKFLATAFFFKERAKKNDLAINFALISSFLLAADGLFLVQSRLAMNDIFLLFFSLLAVTVYFLFLKKKQRLLLILLGLCLGLALASKWSAIFFLLAIFFLEIGQLVRQKAWKKLPWLIFSLIILPLAVYLLAYWPFFAAGKSLSDFLLLHQKIWQYQVERSRTHLYASSPLAWFFNLRPVWYFFQKQAGTAYLQNIYALGNPLLFLYFWPAVIYLLWQRQKQRLLIVFFYFVAFLPWVFSPRIMFFYHYLPALPWMILIISLALVDLLAPIKAASQRRALIFNLLFWPAFTFLLFYPHWTALPVPAALTNALYFLLPTWK